MYTRYLLLSAILVCGVGNITIVDAQSSTVAQRPSARRDLHDVGLLLELAKKLHPDLGKEPLLIRAELGYVDGRMPYTVVLSCVAPGAGGKEPERVAYAGWAQFDAEGRLRVYGTNQTAGARRLASVRDDLAGRVKNLADVLQALRAAGAPYVDEPPPLERLPATKAMLDAVGPIRSVSVPVFDPSADVFNALAESHWRPEVVWRAVVAVEMDSTRRRLSLVVDPWGEVVSVLPLPD